MLYWCRGKFENRLVMRFAPFSDECGFPISVESEHGLNVVMFGGEWKAPKEIMYTLVPWQLQH
jgi:hypothetical protein